MQGVALLVGVGEYDSAGVPNLPITALDAQRLAETLRDPATCGYPAEQVLPLIGPQATLRGLRDALRALRNRATRDTTCIVYFSGHGGRLETSRGWRAYLCPRDTEPERLDETTLSAEEFTAALAAIPAERLVVILDACFAGATAELKAVGHDEQWKIGWVEQQYEALARGSGRVVIASSKAERPSYARQRDGMSLFTKHLIAALQGGAAVRGDGLVHILDVFHYVADAVRRDEPRQEPILKAQNLDANFAVALAPASATAPAQTNQPIEVVRQALVREPLIGAAELSAYLAGRPDAATLRDRVDERRSELERLRREIAQFGRESDLTARNGIVFFLLRVCSDLAAGVLTPVPAPVPAAAPLQRAAPEVSFSMDIHGDHTSAVQGRDITINNYGAPRSGRAGGDGTPGTR